MQIEKTAELPTRHRIKKRYFFASAFLAALTSSMVILPFRVANYIEMDNFCLEPFAGKDRVIQTKVTIKKDYDYFIYFSVTCEKPGEKYSYIHYFADDYPLFYGNSYYYEGTVLPYTFNIKKEYFRAGFNTTLRMSFNFQDFPLPAPDAFEYYSDTVVAGSITPMQITSKMLPFRRDPETTFASYFYGSGFLSERRYYTFDGTGFKDEYLTNHYGLVPLNEMRFTPTYYSFLSEKISMSSGELQILNYVDDFSIGEVKIDEIKKRRYRSIPLELVYEKNYAYLRSKETLYVTKDLRHQTNENHKGDSNWLSTKNIFLPPVKGFAAKNYVCRIVMNDTGECGIDTFTHSFKLVRTANVYGSKFNSDFYVRELLYD